MPAPSTPEIRRAALAHRVSEAVAKGWRVESQGDLTVVLVRGHRTNHVLHLLISFLTGGLWVVAWLFLALTGGELEQRSTITG